jgi:hypothetical protein
MIHHSDRVDKASFLFNFLQLIAEHLPQLHVLDPHNFSYYCILKSPPEISFNFVPFRRSRLELLLDDLVLVEHELFNVFPFGRELEVLHFPDDLLDLNLDSLISESNDSEVSLVVKLDVDDISWCLVLILHHV